MRGAVITGANGFLGSALVKELRKYGIKVLAVARSHNRLPDDPGIERLTLELSQLSTLASLTDPQWDTFYHLAWDGIAGEPRKDAALQLCGVQDTVQAVRAAKALGCGTFIGAGSLMEKEVLAASAEPGLRHGPEHIYSAAKLAAHHMSECAAAELGIYHIWPIITNAYGEGEASPRLLNTTIRKIIRGEALSFTSAVQNYDFIHVQDVARAFRLLGERGKPFREYIIGSGAARPLREFLLELREVLAPEKEFVFGGLPFKGISLPLEAFDIAPLRQDTGFAPEISFSQGIRRTMNWMLATWP
jgi:UDP-glucose 4-epimerase